jgi:hypothetical protein
MTFKGRRRMRTVAFRVDEVTFAKIDVLSGLSGLSKQDYMEARVLDESVVVPSSRVAKMLLEYAQEVYRELLRARREGRALDEDFAWSLLTLSEFLSGFGDGSMRDIDVEIASWERAM